MSLFARAVRHELQELTSNVVREVSGVKHLEHLIAEHGKAIVKNAIGNALTNMHTHVDITGRRGPTPSEQQQWDADREWVRTHFGV
ncbi:MAG: hypothetical protein Aurels2KO_48100 [Aureliella sp.]